MKLINNKGTDRVIDLIRKRILPEGQLDFASQKFSLFAFSELIEALTALEKVKLMEIVNKILLKLGLDLCIPMASRGLACKTVQAIRGGILMTYLAERITRDELEPLAQGILAWQKNSRRSATQPAFFRDNAFQEGVAKTNLSTILEQAGIQNLRSI